MFSWLKGKLNAWLNTYGLLIMIIIIYFCIKLNKRDSKDICDVTNFFILKHIIIETS